MEEPQIAKTSEKEYPEKVLILGKNYLLGQIRIEKPGTKIIMLGDQPIPEDEPRWRVLDKGTECGAEISVGDAVILSSPVSGIDMAISGTPYRVAYETEIVGILTEKSLEWDTAIDENIEENRLELEKSVRKQSRRGGKRIVRGSA